MEQNMLIGIVSIIVVTGIGIVLCIGRITFILARFLDDIYKIANDCNCTRRIQDRDIIDRLKKEICDWSLKYDSLNDAYEKLIIEYHKYIETNYRGSSTKIRKKGE